MQATTNVFSKAVFSRESLEAFLRTKAFRGRSVQVLGLFYEATNGLIQDEVAVAFDMLTQTASGIFTGLSEYGLIIHMPVPGSTNGDYFTRPTRSGYNAAVWVLAPDWQIAAANYRARKKMERETEKAQKNALEENESLKVRLAEVTAILGDVIDLFEDKVPDREPELQAALDAIRKEYPPCTECQ